MSRAVDLASSFFASVFVVLFTLGCASSANHAWAAEPLTASCNPGGPCSSGQCEYNNVRDGLNNCKCYTEFDIDTWEYECGCDPANG